MLCARIGAFPHRERPCVKFRVKLLTLTSSDRINRSHPKGRDCEAPVGKMKYPVFCAAALIAAFLSALPLTASAGPGAASRVTLKVQGQGIVTVGTRSIHCISASATQIVCGPWTVAVPRGRYVGLRERPKAGWTFSTWAGACRGSAPTCRVRVVRPLRVGATFLLDGG